MRINLDLNEKRHDIVAPGVYSYPKQLDAMIGYISTLPVAYDFECFLKNSLLLTKPVFI